MPTTDRRWTRFFFYRKEVLKTTWTFRLLVLASVLLLPWITRGLWAGALGKGLLCEEQGGGTGVDAIVVENFDVNYLVFERASRAEAKGADGPGPGSRPGCAGHRGTGSGVRSDRRVDGADRSNRGTDDDPRPRGGADLVEYRLPGA